MSYTLSNLLRDAWEELGQLQVAKATGGSTTTVIDTKLSGQGKDDDWKGGAVIILRDAAGAAAAPEGEFGRVSAYADATGTLTLEELTAAVAAGDLYGLVSEYFPIQQMISLANNALRSLGDITLIDTTTLDTATDQTEYAAAVAWKRRPPRQVDIQTNKDDADNNLWAPVRDWYFVPAAAGSTGLIVFRTQPPEGYDLRVWYQDVHPRVNAFDDEINEVISPRLATLALVEKALVWQVSRLSGSDDFLEQRLNQAQSDLDRAMMLFPIWKPGKVGRGLGLGRK